jgi:hypothetical protein
MSDALARAAETVLIAASLGVVGIGVALGSASIAGAEPKKFVQSEDSLKMMCARYGGTFSPSGEHSGAMCSWKDGSDTMCNKKQECVIVEPVKTQRDPGLPVLQPMGSLQVVA